MSRTNVGYAAVLAAGLLVAGCGQGVSREADKGSESERLPGRVQLATRPSSTAPLPEVCRLSDRDEVGAIFGVTPREEKAGPFPGTCSYTFPDEPELEVIISDLGSAGTWSQLRDTASTNRGGVTSVADVGEAAFAPGDAKGHEVVVRVEDTIFAVVVTAPSYDGDVEPKVVELARAAASNVT
jgi:hypothetical protein